MTGKEMKSDNRYSRLSYSNLSGEIIAKADNSQFGGISKQYCDLINELLRLGSKSLNLLLKFDTELEHNLGLS